MCQYILYKEQYSLTYNSLTGGPRLEHKYYNSQYLAGEKEECKLTHYHKVWCMVNYNTLQNIIIEMNVVLAHYASATPVNKENIA